MKKLFSVLLSAMLCFSVIVADAENLPVPEVDGSIIISEELPEAEGEENANEGIAPCDSSDGPGFSGDTNG